MQTAVQTVGTYRVDVEADSSGTWATNALRFDTSEQAERYARDLAMRWIAVRAYRVVIASTTPDRERVDAMDPRRVTV